MVEIQIGPVEDDDLSGLNAGTQLPCAFGIVLLGCVNERESRQQTVQVQAHVAFGCGFAATMLGPVHAVGHQFDDRGIDQMNRAPEPVGHAPTLPFARKIRRKPLEMIEHLPEKSLGQQCRSLLARMRERIACRCRGSTDG